MLSIFIICLCTVLCLVICLIYKYVIYEIIINYKNKDIKYVTCQDEFPNQVMCTICQEIVTNTVKTNCDHYFCYDCIIENTNTSKLCPNCKTEINTIYKN